MVLRQRMACFGVVICGASRRKPDTAKLLHVHVVLLHWICISSTGMKRSFGAKRDLQTSRGKGKSDEVHRPCKVVGKSI